MRKEIILLLAFLIFVIPILSANHIITPASFSENEDSIIAYTITINNNDSNQNANITKVEITIPSNMTFINGSQTTTANQGTFSNTSTVLTWENTTYYLVNGSETKNFGFNGNTTTPGNYTIDVTTTNSSGTSSTTINLTINLVVPSCDENWTYTNWSACINGTQTRNATDSSSCDTTDERSSISRSCTNQTSNVTTNTSCIQNWSCTDYSACVGESQVRVCTDLNTCGNETGKPAENQTCVANCVSDWDCEDWDPVECPEDEEQTRTCQDLNSCGTTSGKPSETQSCIYEKSNLVMWIIIISVIIILIIIGAIVITQYSKKKTDELNEAAGVPGAGQPPTGPPGGPPSMMAPRTAPPRRPRSRRLPAKVPTLPTQPPY